MRPLISPFAASLNTKRRIGTTVATLATTSSILMRNGTEAAQVTGFLMKSRTPVTRLTVRPMATARKTQRNAASGMPRLAPSSRKSSTPHAPTSTDSPMVCSVSTMGLDQTEGDSFSQVDSAVVSSQSSNRLMPHLRGDFLVLALRAAATFGDDGVGATEDEPPRRHDPRLDQHFRILD